MAACGTAVYGRCAALAPRAGTRASKQYCTADVDQAGHEIYIAIALAVRHSFANLERGAHKGRVTNFAQRFISAQE